MIVPACDMSHIQTTVTKNICIDKYFGVSASIASTPEGGAKVDLSEAKR